MNTEFNIKHGLAKAINREDLTREEMRAVMSQIMTGGAEEAQIGGFLVALRMKGESLDEIIGAVEVMRELSTKVNVVGVPHLVDIVGTGGDGANLFNVSSASAFVAAAAGCSVAKHGNRSVSSSSGSADVLERAGVKLDLTPDEVASCVADVGVGFMFAPAHHSAMKHAIGARKALAQRTIFNILGPMTNPAGVKSLVIGVFDKALCRPIADVMNALGAEHVMVVHSEDGLDEISVAAPTYVAELKAGSIREYVLMPETVGIYSTDLEGLCVENAEQSYDLIRGAFGDERAPVSKVAIQNAQRMIALNAGAAIYVSGVADTLKTGVNRAVEMMQNSKALGRLNELAQYCKKI